MIRLFLMTTLLTISTHSFAIHEITGFTKTATRFMWATGNELFENNDQQVYCFEIDANDQVMNLGLSVKDHFCKGIKPIKFDWVIEKNQDVNCYRQNLKGGIIAEVADELCQMTTPKPVQYKLLRANQVMKTRDTRVACYGFNALNNIMNSGFHVDPRFCQN